MVCKRKQGFFFLYCFFQYPTALRTLQCGVHTVTYLHPWHDLDGMGSWDFEWRILSTYSTYRGQTGCSFALLSSSVYAVPTYFDQLQYVPVCQEQVTGADRVLAGNGPQIWKKLTKKVAINTRIYI